MEDFDCNPARMIFSNDAHDRLTDDLKRVKAKNATWHGGLGSFKWLDEKDVEAIYRLGK